MRNAFVFFLIIFITTTLFGDEQTRAIQERLREQGFYYGEVDGHGGDETSAAIRRYQIRHGLRVTGEANDETLRSLGITGDDNQRHEPQYQDDRRYYDRQPNDSYFRRQPDQPFFDQRERVPDNYEDGRSPYYRMPGVATTYPRLFAGTVYERAPGQIQENVVYAVQGELFRRGFYRGRIDGQLGPATTEAIVRFQEDEGMPLTGRLDNFTLNELRALPGQRNGPPEEGFRRSPGGERIFRGIPVQ